MMKLEITGHELRNVFQSLQELQNERLPMVLAVSLGRIMKSIAPIYAEIDGRVSPLVREYTKDERHPNGLEVITPHHARWDDFMADDTVKDALFSILEVEVPCRIKESQVVDAPPVRAGVFEPLIMAGLIEYMDL